MQQQRRLKEKQDLHQDLKQELNNMHSHWNIEKNQLLDKYADDIPSFMLETAKWSKELQNIIPKQHDEKKYECLELEISNVSSSLKKETEINTKIHQYNMRLFIRIKRGAYKLNPDIAIKCNDEWVHLSNALQ